MKVVVIIFINLVLSLIQTSFFGGLVEKVFVPNLIFAFAFSLMFKDLKETSLMSAFIGGIMLDLLGFNIIGISPLVMVASLYLFFLVRRHISKSWAVNLLIFSISVTLYDYILGNLANVGIKNYALFILGMFGISILFYLLIDSFVSYLKRLGVEIEE